jgi:O-succinylbenzoate synthase
MWIAMADRAGIVAEKVPALDTVYLLNHQMLLPWNARSMQLTSYQSMKSTKWWRR